MKKITIEEAEQRIKERFPTENFKIIKYTKWTGHGEVQCLKCNEIIKINSLSNFVIYSKAYGCKNCNGLWKEREKKIQLLKERYDILDTYVKNTHTIYKVKCKKCGHIRETYLNNFMKNLQCGCETKVYRGRTGIEFINECNKYYNNELELIGEYKNQSTKVLLKHIPCGFIWSVRPSDIIHGRSHCPKCRTMQSQGELKIAKILTNLNIKFLEQEPLKNSKQRFDFFLPDYQIAIEYNGSQHYIFSPFFHKTEEGFLKYKERDMKKQQYCIDNNIDLLIISYLQDNDIEKIIVNKISSTTKVGQVSEKAALPLKEDDIVCSHMKV